MHDYADVHDLQTHIAPIMRCVDLALFEKNENREIG